MLTLRALVQQKIIDSNLGFKEVAGAAGLSAIIDSRLSTPGCYVFRTKVLSSSNQIINSISQRITENIGLVIVTNNVIIGRGAEPDDENEIFSKKVQDALLGWQPTEFYDNFEYAGGALVSFSNGLLVWQENYKTSSYITSN